jgi:hypothetical protein
MYKKNRRCYRFEQNFETVRWNKEIKRTAKKTKFQTSTCAKQETPKKKCKKNAKPKIPKKIMKENRTVGQGPGPTLRPQGRARPRASHSPADVCEVKRPRSLRAWLLSLRWVSTHFTSTFVTSCVTKVEVPPSSTTI